MIGDGMPVAIIAEECWARHLESYDPGDDLPF
jgi:hypothetical protein